MNQKQEIVLYRIDDTNVCVSVHYENETFWLTVSAMAELFDCTQENIIQHLQNIYKEVELEKEATTKKFLVVRKEGNREVKRNIEALRA